MSIYGGKIGARMNNLVIVGDADAIIAQTDPNDIHHQKANEISNKLKEKNAQVIYPVSAVLEAATHMQRVLNSTASAYGTAVIFSEPSVQVIEVNQNTLRKAVTYFNPDTSKKNTLFDCTVAAVAEEYKADAIFSFDGFYKKKGFKLASELENN
jgi:predicted nucleic acid-binding protein